MRLFAKKNEVGPTEELRPWFRTCGTRRRRQAALARGKVWTSPRGKGDRRCPEDSTKRDQVRVRRAPTFEAASRRRRWGAIGARYQGMDNVEGRGRERGGGRHVRRRARASLGSSGRRRQGQRRLYNGWRRGRLGKARGTKRLE